MTGLKNRRYMTNWETAATFGWSGGVYKCNWEVFSPMSFGKKSSSKILGGTILEAEEGWLLLI